MTLKVIMKKQMCILRKSVQPNKLYMTLQKTSN